MSLGIASTSSLNLLAVAGEEQGEHLGEILGLLAGAGMLIGLRRSMFVVAKPAPRLLGSRVPGRGGREGEGKILEEVYKLGSLG